MISANDYIRNTDSESPSAHASLLPNDFRLRLSRTDARICVLRIFRAPIFHLLKMPINENGITVRQINPRKKDTSNGSSQ